MYLKILVCQSKNYYLTKIKKIDLASFRYVLSIEKRLMVELGIESRIKLLDLIIENKVVNFNDNPRKMIIVDCGDKLASELLVESQIKPRDYYVHTHITNDSMYLKLKQVVDVTEYNGGTPSTSDIIIKDKFVTMENTFEQVCETLWITINSLDEKDREAFWINKFGDLPNYVNDYEIFKKQVTTILKEDVCIVHPLLTTIYDY